MKLEILELYEEASLQVEGDLHLLSVLVLFFEPTLKYSNIKTDFDNMQNIEKYEVVFNRICDMRLGEVKNFLSSYYNQVDGSVAFLREAIVDTFKQKSPKYNKVSSIKKPCINQQGNLFANS
jgi:hypothetical protein